MPVYVNVADFKDPNDPQGRSYREVNKQKKHLFSVGQLVELENGCRLFVVRLTRDCDQTPLYSLAIDPEGQGAKCHHGYDEGSLAAV